MPGVPAGQLAGFSGTNGWMPALLTPASLRFLGRLSGRIPGPPHILRPAGPSVFRRSYSGVMGVGDTSDGGGGTGVSEGDLGIVREAQPGPAFGPNSLWDANERLKKT